MPKKTVTSSSCEVRPRVSEYAEKSFATEPVEYAAYIDLMIGMHPGHHPGSIIARFMTQTPLWWNSSPPLKPQEFKLFKKLLKHYQKGVDRRAAKSIGSDAISTTEG